MLPKHPNNEAWVDPDLLKSLLFIAQRILIKRRSSFTLQVNTCHSILIFASCVYILFVFCCFFIPDNILASNFREIVLKVYWPTLLYITKFAQ